MGCSPCIGRRTCLSAQRIWKVQLKFINQSGVTGVVYDVLGIPQGVFVSNILPAICSPVCTAVLYNSRSLHIIHHRDLETGTAHRAASAGQLHTLLYVSRAGRQADAAGLQQLTTWIVLFGAFHASGNYPAGGYIRCYHCNSNGCAPLSLFLPFWS